MEDGTALKGDVKFISKYWLQMHRCIAPVNAAHFVVLYCECLIKLVVGTVERTTSVAA